MQNVPRNAKISIYTRKDFDRRKIIALFGWCINFKKNVSKGSGILINIYAGGNFCSFGQEQNQWET